MNTVENNAALQTSPITIRRAERPDADALITLIIALGEFEKLPPPDADAQARLIADGFGERPRYEAYLAFKEGVTEPVGYAFIIETYSTFLALPTLYLEDLFVLADYRRQGVGGALLKHLIGLAQERGCGRMEWTCLGWNTDAQAVYEKLGAHSMDEWLMYRLTGDALHEVKS